MVSEFYLSKTNTNNCSYGNLCMGLFDWFNKSVHGDKLAKLETAPEEEVLAGINLKQVLDAHTAWKTKLQNALDGTSAENLDVAQVCQDDLCTLGKWLYGEGKNK